MNSELNTKIDKIQRQNTASDNSGPIILESTYNENENNTIDLAGIIIFIIALTLQVF